MRDADKPAFAGLIKDAMAFYRQDVTTFALSVWWQACQPFDMEQVAKAITRHATDPEHGQFAPKPADIVRILAGTATDRSLLAWGKVFDAIRRVGGYRSVAFDDPVIHSVIEDMGGWTKLCRLDLDDMPFTQKRFCETYRAITRSDHRAFPPYLPGESEVSNAKLGFSAAQPVLIGNSDAARDVMRLGVRGSKTPITASAALAIGAPS